MLLAVRSSRCLLLLVLVAASARTAWAQPAAEPEAAPEALPVEVEESPLLTEPTTPEGMFRATVLMADIARPALARLYLEQFLATNPDDELLLEMRDRHGTATFLKLANMPELQPLSVRLLEQVNDASRRRAADPAYIDRLVRDLGGTPAQRDVALRDLRNLGPVAAPRLIQRLADVHDRANHGVIAFALTRMGRHVIPPLIGALSAPDHDVQGAMIEVLGHFDDPRIAPYLWYPAYGPDQPTGLQLTAREALARLLYGSPHANDRLTVHQAIAELERAARRMNRGEHDWTVAPDGTVTLWFWNDELATVAARQVPLEIATAQTGRTFARQALALSPESGELQVLYLALGLSAEARMAGWERPLPSGPGTAYDMALLAGPEVVSNVLASALQQGHPQTAAAALKALGQTATRHQLYWTGGDRSPILSALNYPDPRVQFTAATTVLQLDPDKPFPGSDRVIEIMARALADEGLSTALIVDADVQRAGNVSGFVSHMGLAPQILATGREAFATAAERAGIRFIVLHVNTLRWELSQTVANLRADARTARIPLVIYGPEETRPRVQGLMNRSGLMTYVAEGVSAQEFEFQVASFLRSLQSPPLTAQQRENQRLAAAYWLSHIGTGRRTEVFDLAPAESALFEAANDPATARQAVAALGAIATPTTQERLAELALNNVAPPEVREHAALQLAFHIQRFGLLLSEDQVRAVRRGWQTAAEPEVKTALASVLGSLKPNAKAVAERLGEGQ